MAKLILEAIKKIVGKPSKLKTARANKKMLKKKKKATVKLNKRGRPVVREAVPKHKPTSRGSEQMQGQGRKTPPGNANKKLTEAQLIEEMKKLK